MNPAMEERLSRLEKNIRYYRLSLAALIIVVAGALLMSFNNHAPIPDMIQAKAFQVVDESGRVLVNINKEGDGGQISTMSESGKKLVSFFTSDGGGGGMNTFDRDGRVIFKVTRTTGGGGYLALFNSLAKEVVEWGTTDSESGYYRVNDRNGDKLAWLTYTQGGGGYFSLSNAGKETLRFSTPAAGARMSVYNGSGTRVCYIGAQDNQDGNATIWNNAGTRTGGVPQ